MDAQDSALARLIDQVRDAGARRASLDICGGGTKRFYGESPCGAPLPAGATPTSILTVPGAWK